MLVVAPDRVIEIVTFAQKANGLVGVVWNHGRPSRTYTIENVSDLIRKREKLYRARRIEVTYQLRYRFLP